MTKEELIEKLFKEFEKDKNIIKLNLLKAMDCVCLKTTNEYNEIEMTIKIERRCDGNENIK